MNIWTILITNMFLILATVVRMLSQIFTSEAGIIFSTHEELRLKNMPKLTDLTKSRAKIQAQINLLGLTSCFVQ